jgi:serpin B
MLMKTALPIALLVMLISTGRGHAADPQTPSPEHATTAAAGNRLALELYGQLRQRPGNLFFSPLSIHTCLAMAALGARGETALQMHRVLGVEPDAKMPRPLPMLQQNPADKDIPFELRMANALWGQRGYGWRPQYLEALQTQYGAGLREVDFARATEAAGQINQ